MLYTLLIFMSSSNKDDFSNYIIVRKSNFKIFCKKYNYKIFLFTKYSKLSDILHNTYHFINNINYYFDKFINNIYNYDMDSIIMCEREITCNINIDDDINYINGLKILEVLQYILYCRVINKSLFDIIKDKFIVEYIVIHFIELFNNILYNKIISINYIHMNKELTFNRYKYTVILISEINSIMEELIKRHNFILSKM